MRRATQLLQDMAAGDSSAADELFPLVYDQLRGLAAAFFRDERPEHSLQPTALVHEAYLRLIDSPVGGAGGMGEVGGAGGARPRTRAHFQALAARVMRHVLVDHARARDAAKRGGDRTRVTLSDMAAGGEESAFDFESLDRALSELAELNERTARVVELRFFGSLTLEEAAEHLGISLSSAEREWRFARAWLMDRLSGRDAG
jgi:RNA polymerase sigma factor (sigma-70 family)